MAIKIGTLAPNTIIGTSKSDLLIGLSGDDIIYGGLGDDIIEGGLGIDTAVFSGRLQDYRIQQITKIGLLTTVSGADGCDTLSNVEILKFDNGTYDLRTGVTTITTVSIAGGNTVQEGDGHTLNYTFTRTGDLSGTLDVRYGFNGTAGPADYVDPSGGVLHFAAGSATATLALKVVDDTLVEPTETVGVHLVADTHYDFGPASSATGTILDNDTLPSLSINDVVTTEHLQYIGYANNPYNGGTTANPNGGYFDVNFTVSLSQATNHDVTFHFATNPGTALTSSNGVINTNGDITIAAGQTSALIHVNGIDDFVNMPDRQFHLALSNATGATILDGDGLGTIHEDDLTPAVTVSAVAPSVTEGGDLVVSFHRTITGVPLDVTYAFGPPSSGAAATAGSDYIDPGLHTVHFGATDTDATLTIRTIDDALTENTEGFTVSLVAPGGPAPVYTTYGSMIVSLSIADNDPTPTVSVSSDVTQVVEGGNFTLTFHRDGNLASTLDASYQIGSSGGPGSATAGSDYVDPASHAIHFAAGQSDVPVTLLTNDDSTPEYLEYFTVSVAPPPANPAGPPSYMASAGYAALSIADNDPVPVVSVTAPVTVVEGGSVDFTFHRTGNLGAALDVAFQIGAPSGSSGATLGVDFTDPGTRSVHFDANQADSALTIHTIDDTILENAEAFSVSVSAPTPGGQPPAYVPASDPSMNTHPGFAGVQIMDNDRSTVSLAVDHNSVVEGGAFTLTFHRDLTANPLDVAYNYTGQPAGPGNATPGVDFTDPASHIVHFGVNQADATLVIQTANDTLVEGGESFGVAITPPAPVAGQPFPYQLATGAAGANFVGLTITDNNSAPPAALPTIGVTAQDGTASESTVEGQDLQFVFTRSGDTSQGLDVGYTINTNFAHAATIGDDFTLPPNTVTHTISGPASGQTLTAAPLHFAAGSSTASLTFKTVMDHVTEDIGNQGEAFALGIEPSSTSAYMFDLAHSSVAVQIHDLTV